MDEMDTPAYQGPIGPVGVVITGLDSYDEDSDSEQAIEEENAAIDRMIALRYGKKDTNVSGLYIQ